MARYQVNFTKHVDLYFYIEADTQAQAITKAHELPDSAGEISENEDFDYNGCYLVDEQGTPI